MRKLVIVALASGVFGGVMGALATAATQSQASPEAIAAAVQKVQDAKTENQLVAVNAKLARLATRSDMGKIDYTLWAICRDTPGTLSDAGQCGPLIPRAP